MWFVECPDGKWCIMYGKDKMFILGDNGPLYFDSRADAEIALQQEVDKQNKQMVP